MSIFTIPGFTEPVSSITHLLASGIFFIMGIWLINKSRGNKLRVFSVCIFVFSNVFLFAMSGVYHLLDKGSTGNYVMRILDYDGIYLLIAGTFTPLHIIMTRGFRRWGVLALVWLFGILGIVFTSIFFSNMPTWLSLVFYLGMGWLGVIIFVEIYYTNRASAVDIFCSGMAYTFGALFDAFNWPIIWEGVIGPHEIFHFGVVIGAAFNWRILARICTYPISPKLVGIINEFPGDKFEGYFTTEKASFCAESLDDLKVQMHDWIHNKYLKNHLPSEIKYQYFKQEIVLISTP